MVVLVGNLVLTDCVRGEIMDYMARVCRYAQRPGESARYLTLEFQQL